MSPTGLSKSSTARTSPDGPPKPLGEDRPSELKVPSGEVAEVPEDVTPGRRQDGMKDVMMAMIDQFRVDAAKDSEKIEAKTPKVNGAPAKAVR